MPIDLPYPTPEDFRIEETELAPGQIIGSFQVLPPDAFCGSTVVRSYQVPFMNPGLATDDPKTALGYLGPFISQVLGYATYDEGGFTRVLPWVDFHFRHMVASRVDIGTRVYGGLDESTNPEELPPLSSSNLYKYLTMQVHFASPRFRLGERFASNSQYGVTPEFETSRFFMAEIKRGIKYFTSKPGVYQWILGSDSHADILFDVPLPQPFEDIILTWLALPPSAIPFSALDRCRNKTNYDVVVLPDIPKLTSDNLAYQESLVLHTYQIIPDYFPNGDECAHLQMVLKHRPSFIRGPNNEIIETFGWNGFVYPGDGTYKRVRRKGSTSDDPTDPGYIGLFPFADFDGLFDFEPLI